jgi:hypothetical protein
VNLIGNGPETLAGHMLGNDLEPFDGIWTCGKDGQSVWSASMSHHQDRQNHRRRNRDRLNGGIDLALRAKCRVVQRTRFVEESGGAPYIGVVAMARCSIARTGPCPPCASWRYRTRD